MFVISYLANKYREVIYKNILNENKILKNIHQGERCFIIGNGSSLKNLDLSKLKNEYIFVCNSFSKYEKFKDLKINFFGFIEPIKALYEYPQTSYYHPDYWFGWLDEAYTDPDTKIFFRIDARKYLLKRGLFKNKQVHYLLSYKNALARGKLSDDITKGFSFMNGTLVYQIPLCAYMGFKEIYLIGFDYDSIVHKTQIHFYADSEPQYEGAYGESNKWLAYNLYKGLEVLESVKKYCDKKGVKVYNAGIGGFIDVFDRVEFNSIDFKKSRD